MRGVILFGHGSRDPLWRGPIDAIARRMRDARPAVQVICAFLEFDSPDLPTAGQDFVARGVDDLAIVPVFLGTGRHAREDLPRLVEELRVAHPQVHIELRAAIGEDERVLDLIAAVALE